MYSFLINRPASTASSNRGDSLPLPSIDFQYRFSSQSPAISEEGDEHDYNNNNNDNDDDDDDDDGGFRELRRENEKVEPCEIISPSVEGTISSSYMHNHEGVLRQAYEIKYEE